MESLLQSSLKRVVIAAETTLARVLKAVVLREGPQQLADCGRCRGHGAAGSRTARKRVGYRLGNLDCLTSLRLLSCQAKIVVSQLINLLAVLRQVRSLFGGVGHIGKPAAPERALDVEVPLLHIAIVVPRNVKSGTRGALQIDGCLRNTRNRGC